MGIAEQTLIAQMNKFIRERRGGGQQATGAQQSAAIATPMPHQPAPKVDDQAQASAVELMIVQLIIRHGDEVVFENVEDDSGNSYNLTIAQFINYNLAIDGLSLSDNLHCQILAEAVAHSGEPGFKAERYFIDHDDINISRLAADMATDKFHLAESQQPRNDKEALRQRALHLVLDFRMDYLERRLKAIRQEIKQVGENVERMRELMNDFKDISELRNSLARKLGSNIIL